MKDEDVALSTVACLVAEDSPLMLKMLQTILMHLGLRQVYCVTSGEEAMQFLHNTLVDALITDWDLPGMTGVDLAASIRSHNDNKISTLPIVMVTGHGDPNTVLMARDTGINEFVVKPFSPEQIRLKLVSALKRSGNHIRTRDYFGPDRRRRDRPFSGPDRRAENFMGTAEEFTHRLQNMRETLEILKKDFEVYAIDAVNRMGAELRGASAEPASMPSCLERLFALAHGLKGSGSSFGYPVITEISVYLCDYLRKPHNKARPDVYAIANCISAMATILNSRGVRLSNELEAKLLETVKRSMGTAL